MVWMRAAGRWQGLRKAQISGETKLVHTVYTYLSFSLLSFFTPFTSPVALFSTFYFSSSNWVQWGYT